MTREHRLAVLVDFDGTASLSDVGGQLLEAFARDNTWMVIDNDYLSGRVGSRTAYRLAEQLLHYDPRKWLHLALELARLDPGLKSLARVCRERRWPLEITSDGLEFYIRAILHAEGIDLPVRANHTASDGNRPLVHTPHMNPLCGRCGNCKSDRVETLKRQGFEVVYIGDGYSDLCAAPKADRVFAKSVLAEHCRARGVPYEEFQELEDVVRSLQESPKQTSYGS